MLHTLTDTKIRSTQPSTRTQRLFDGGGLYLEVSPAGGRWWRLKYRIDGKEKRISLGTYPAILLKTARERAATARLKLANNIDPSVERQAIKASRQNASQNSFEVVAREWSVSHHMPTVSPGQSARVLRRLERDLFPWVGKTPISELDGVTILQALRRVESRGAIETAHRELHAISQVFRYAVATGRALRDPCADLRGALKPFISKNMAAITDPLRVGDLLRAINGYQGSFPVRCALQLGALTFVRPGELRNAEWKEFDLDAHIWQIPSARMKGKLSAKSNGPDHVVPLSHQALAILRELHPLTGHHVLLFPSVRGMGRPMSDGTVNAALRTLGFSQEEMTGHGFRAMARTLLAERLGVAEEVIEAQLAHQVKGALGRAYNRTTFLAQRTVMMQQWADYLYQLQPT